VPTLQTAGTNDRPASTRRHAVAKAVVLGPPAGMRLIGPLHFPLVLVVVARSTPAQGVMGAPCNEDRRDVRGCGLSCYALADGIDVPRRRSVEPRLEPSPVPALSTWAPSAGSSLRRPGVPCVGPGLRLRRGDLRFGGPTSPGPPHIPSEVGWDETSSNPHLWICLWTYPVTGERSPR
jgi:hypothetical protein